MRSPPPRGDNCIDLRAPRLPHAAAMLGLRGDGKRPAAMAATAAFSAYPRAPLSGAALLPGGRRQRAGREQSARPVNARRPRNETASRRGRRKTKPRPGAATSERGRAAPLPGRGGRRRDGAALWARMHAGAGTACCSPRPPLRLRELLPPPQGRAQRPAAVVLTRAQALRSKGLLTFLSVNSQEL